MAGMLDGLEVHSANMARNVDATNGLILAEAYALALGARIGRMEAHELIEQASQDAVRRNCSLKASVREALAKHEATRELLGDHDLDRLGDPANYLGEAQSICDRVLASWAGSSS
ncbi:3-carboxy-cis,cis-muconate cycloisomerase [compost metagenome]